MSATLDSPSRSGAAILGRVLKPDAQDWSPEAARALLELEFPKSDMRRMNVLASKARRGTLTEDERVEAEQYNLIGHFLALLQAKARRCLPARHRDA